MLKKSLDYYLVLLVILLIPYDSFPLPVAGSTKSISLLPFLVLLLLLIPKINFSVKLSNSTKYLIGYFLWALFITTIMAGLLNYLEIKQTNTLAAGFKGGVQICIFMVVYGVFNIWFEDNSHAKIKYILRMILISSYFPLSMGALNLIGNILGIESIQYIYIALRQIFVNSDADMFSHVRNSLLTLEPAWASMQIACLYLPVSIYAYKNKLLKGLPIKIYMILIVVNIVATGSSYWIGWILLIPFSKAIFLKEKFMKINSVRIAKILVLLGILFGVSFLFNEKIELFSYQLLKIQTIIDAGLGSEGSTAIRLYTPIIALQTITLNNIFSGIGLNQFGFYIPFVAPDWYAQVGEGIDFVDLSSEYLATPRNLYIRILLENGIVGAVMFALFIFYIYKNLREFGRKKDGLYWFVITSSYGILYSWINYDSMANFYIPLLFSINGLIIKLKAEKSNA